jgi:predicted nucleic acid-binding protein
MDSVCVDASVAVKLFLAESGSETARGLWETWLDNGTTIWVPAVFHWEAAHAVRGAMNRGACDGETAFEAILGITELPVSVLPETHRSLSITWERFIAPFGYQVSAYDAAYLAVGAATNSVLWTADERLVRTVESELSWVRSLSEAVDHSEGAVE